MEEIGDYAIASGLNYAVCGSIVTHRIVNSWLNDAKERWGEQFIGIYYGDQPGGKMLDITFVLEKTVRTDEGYMLMYDSIIKNENGGIATSYGNGTYTTYQPDGTIQKNMLFYDTPDEIRISYYPNGTITVDKFVPNFENGDYYTPTDRTKYQHLIQSYDELLKQNPIQSHEDVAKAFVNVNKEDLENNLNKTRLDELILVFTADYGLYWWDYQSGYDMILAELGWNNSITQEIGLVRGAANLQDKSWGTILTWKYTHAPYPSEGKEMFEQMKTSYQAGAEYVIIFNYSEDPHNPNTLQEEHFQALERFWNDVVQNPKVKHGDIKANAVIVLPRNYGCGMRHQGDNIWGIWQSDETSKQVWSQLQAKQSKHGLKLDIVFEDPNYPVEGRYANVYYWS
jgi:hypothetical protein